MASLRRQLLEFTFNTNATRKLPDTVYFRSITLIISRLRSKQDSEASAGEQMDEREPNMTVSSRDFAGWLRQLYPASVLG